ncbi:baseplate J/gp47 family protein [Bradyrhizobium sp. Pear76]|uniref:baseplate J/gp47 family protein n=1 Tax=Bradyrhizobium oropedii TaxID=1571201 RepID=UPI001E447F60|nr:baseplate J/gp47 family protein [Bradyrhizobium oropedii]MCC8963783.1 baseplate J/gp47 family protein [Bradyrhizobium oropedii]
MAQTLVPSFTFGPTGFVAPSGPAVLTGVQGDINAAFGNTLNYQLTTPQGQLAQSQAAVISNTYGTFQYYTQQVDPAYATGRMQDAIGRIYFMERDPAEPTILQLNCTGGPITIPVGALVQDSSLNLYACTQATQIPPIGSVVVPFACTVPGPVSVPQTVTIYQGVNGWDTVAVVSGVIGSNVEGRAAFETRRQDSVAGNSFGAAGSIIGAVSKVSGVLDYFGYSNNTPNPVTLFGVTIPANSIYISVAGGTQSAVATAILSKKGGGAPMAGNTTVTVYDNNPLYATPIPYQITYTIPAPLQLVWNVVLVNNPLVPSDAATQVQNALITALAGQSTLNPAPPKARIASTVYAANYIPAIAALGSWAQVASISVGSTNAPVAVVVGNITGTTLNVVSVTSGSISPGNILFDPDNRIVNGTSIVSGSGGVGSYTINNPQTLGATFTGTGAGTNLTVSAVTGVIGAGDVLSGAGVPANTTIVSGPAGGGAGVYVTSNPTTSAGAALTTNAVISVVSGNGTSVAVHANQVPQTTAPNIAVSTT